MENAFAFAPSQTMTRRFAFFSDGKKGRLLLVNIIAILFIAIFILIVIRRGENDKSEERVRKKHNLPTRVISRTEIFLLGEKKT